MSIPGLAELEPFLLELNRVSGEAILPLFRGDHGLVDKGGEKGFDPVTAADKAGEAAIRALVETHYPDHGFIGEEYGAERADAEFVWVLDPIDGTRAFISGLPLWTTLIGLRFQGKPALGSIGQPFLGEVYMGHAGGSRLVTRDGERPLQTRRGVPLSSAIIATTDSDGLFSEGEFAAWRALRKATRLARFGCDAYAYAMVAAGTMDLVLETRLKAWDIDAAIPVLIGAGGAATNWRGEEIGSEGGQIILAGDPAHVERVVEIMSPAAV
jgi:histidinol phosphatase-like enzyme (inositol monophosphatase family)